MVRWCCYNTARQVGLEHQKGDLAVGWDADICVFDPEATWIVGEEGRGDGEGEERDRTMWWRNKCSAYQGKELRGVVRETWVRGQRVFVRGEGFVAKGGPRGQLLLEPRTSWTM